MARISLHRASRVQERIRAAIGRLHLANSVQLSIFAADPDGEVARHAERLRGDVGRLQRLLLILAALRTAVGCANAAEGISGLLAEKAGVEEEITLLEKVLGDPGSRDTARRRAGFLSEPEPAAPAAAGLDLATQVRAARARFEAGDPHGDDFVHAPILDAATAEDLRARILALRRRLEAISDSLRTLNGSVEVAIEDDALAYLQREGVL